MTKCMYGSFEWSSEPVMAGRCMPVVGHKTSLNLQCFYNEQECIAVRCAPSASVATTRCQYRGWLPCTYPPSSHTHPTPTPKRPVTRHTNTQKGPGTSYTTPLWSDTRLWKHYLPPTSLAGGNNTRWWGDYVLRRPLRAHNPRCLSWP